MYRKHLKMARGKGEAEVRPGLRSYFVERVVRLPIVHVAWDYAANTYSTIKESNRLVNFTLTNAEKSVTFMADQAKPVVMKFEKQIQAVDKLACKGLGTLEEKVPFITKRPDEMIDDTKGLYTSTIYSRFEDIVKYGNNKVKNVTDLGLQTLSVMLANPVVNSMLASVDGALVVTENYINHFLHLEEREQNDNQVSSNHTGDGGKQRKVSVTARIARISAAVRKRGYQIIVVRWRGIQEVVLEFRNAPDYLFSVAFGQFEVAKRHIESLWDDLNSDGNKEQNQRNIVLKQLLLVARPTAKQIAILYGKVSVLIPKVPVFKENNNKSTAVNNGVVSKRTRPEESDKNDKSVDTREEDNSTEREPNHVQENDDGNLD